MLTPESLAISSAEGAGLARLLRRLLGQNAKGPQWGLSHFGGEGGIRTRGTL